jgi:hypothetical protein
MSDWTLWRGRPLQNEIETTNNSAGAIEVGALTILGTFALTDRKKDDGDKLGPADRE